MKLNGICLAMAFCAVGSFAEEAVLPEESGLKFKYGADLRVRQEIMDNIPGHPGEPGSAYAAPAGKNANWIRYRPRAWAGVDSEHFGLFLRVADEMREYVVKNGKRRDDRSYNFPDEVILDNIYFEGRDLFDGFLDFRIGRQDFLDNGKPAFGSGRVVMDGTPYDGSRSLFFDAARFTLHTTEKSTLDFAAIYDNSRNELHWGRPTPDPRPVNAIDPRDEPDMDVFGAILYYKNNHLQALPFELYYVYMHSQDYFCVGTHMPSRSDNTFGFRLLPKFTEELEGELEGAAQVGEKGDGASTCGFMGYAGLKWKPELEIIKPAKPYLGASCYYMSGDRERGAGHNDTGWNPVWGRWPQESEMFCYGPMYGLGYWSNMTYPSLSAGANIGRRHSAKLQSGPFFASVEDGLGGGNGSDYEGWLTVARYDFPLWKNEGGRGELFGHLLAECFQPGDYYESDKTAYFFRWEITLAF